MPERFKTIAIKDALHEALMQQYQKEIKEMEFPPSFTSRVSKLLSDQLEERKRARNQR